MLVHFIAVSSSLQDKWLLRKELYKRKTQLLDLNSLLTKVHLCLFLGDHAMFGIDVGPTFMQRKHELSLLTCL